MWRRGFTLVVLGLSMLVPLACGSSSTTGDCVALCKKGESCPGASIRPYDTCEEGCALLEDIIDETDCGDAYRDFLDCGLNQDPTCHLEDTCPAESAGYSACFLTYCISHPQRCDEITCTFSKGGISPSCSLGARCGTGPEYALDCDAQAMQCSCTTDGEITASVAFDSVYCEADSDVALDAARAACAWDL